MALIDILISEETFTSIISTVRRSTRTNQYRNQDGRGYWTLTTDEECKRHALLSITREGTASGARWSFLFTPNNKYKTSLQVTSTDLGEAIHQMRAGLISHSVEPDTQPLYQWGIEVLEAIRALTSLRLPKGVELHGNGDMICAQHPGLTWRLALKGGAVTGRVGYIGPNGWWDHLHHVNEIQPTSPDAPIQLTQEFFDRTAEVAYQVLQKHYDKEARDIAKKWDIFGSHLNTSPASCPSAQRVYVLHIGTDANFEIGGVFRSEKAAEEAALAAFRERWREHSGVPCPTSYYELDDLNDLVDAKDVVTLHVLELQD